MNNKYNWDEEDIIYEEPVSKYNPHHDDLGRFTSGPGGKRPKIKRGASKGKRKKVVPKARKVYSAKFSGFDDMSDDLGVNQLVKAGILSINDLKICAMQYADSTPDFIDERNVDMGYVPSGELQEPSVFYKIVAQKLLANGLRKTVSDAELLSAISALQTTHDRVPRMAKVELSFNPKIAAEQGVLHEEFARYVIDSWAGSSGSQMSLFTSASARAFLDADGVFVGEGGAEGSTNDRSYEMNMSKILYYLNTGATPQGSRELVKTLKGIVQTTYENTQKLLESQGITHVRVYRGHNGTAEDGNVRIPNTGEVHLSTITTRPLSSWSLTPDTAQDFGQILVTSVVKREQVYAFPTTGIGCFEESEAVLKGFDYEPAPVFVGDSYGGMKEVKRELDSLADEVSANPEKYEVY